MCKSPCYFLPSLELIGLSVQETKSKIDFQDGRYGSHLRFRIITIFATFDLPVAPIVSTKFLVSWLFGSGEEAIFKMAAMAASLDFRSE